jgi:hypothetical protein
MIKSGMSNTNLWEGAILWKIMEISGRGFHGNQDLVKK